jgi:hypothetical protein
MKPRFHLPAAGVLLGLALVAVNAGSAFAQSSPAAAADQPAASFSVRPTQDQDINNPKDAFRDHVQASKSWFQFHAQAGDVISDSLEVVNTGPVAGDALVYAVDAATGATSGMVLQNRDVPATGVGSWVQLSASTIHLDPGAAKTVDFTVKVPAGAGAGEHWGGLMVEDTNVRQGAGQFTVNTVMRTGLALGVTLPGPAVQKLAITGVSEDVQNNLHEVFTINIANQGTALVKPKGQFVLKDASGQTVASHDLQLDSILAGSSVPYQFFWPDDKSLQTGKYSVSVNLAYPDGSNPATFSTDMQIQAPGKRIEAVPSASGQAGFAVVANNQAAEQPAAKGASTSGPLQTLLPAVIGGAVVLVGLGAFQLGRRRSSATSTGRPD